MDIDPQKRGFPWWRSGGCGRPGCWYGSVPLCGGPLLPEEELFQPSAVGAVGGFHHLWAGDEPFQELCFGEGVYGGQPWFIVHAHDHWPFRIHPEKRKRGQGLELMTEIGGIQERGDWRGKNAGCLLLIFWKYQNDRRNHCRYSAR